MGVVSAMVFEEALRFGESHRLIGIMSRGSDLNDGPPGVVFLNSGIIHRVGPNRLYVELARGMTERLGAHTLRFDLAGIGDSGAPRSTTLADSVRDDVTDAVDHLCASTGTDRVILTGLCSGADNAFTAALRDPRVVGLILMDPSAFKTWGFHARRLWQKATSPTSWRNLFSRQSVVRRAVRTALRRLRGQTAEEDARPAKPAFYGMSTRDQEETRRGLEELVQRRVRLLYVFTGGLRERYNYERQFEDAFRQVDFQGRLRVAYFPAADHTFSRAQDRRQLLDKIVEWLGQDGWRGAVDDRCPRRDAAFRDSHTAPGRGQPRIRSLVPDWD